jgi:hypothetical protein
VAPSVEATIRARFSAILKKDISYLLKTSHPDLHTFMYGSEPGQSLRQLQDDLWNTGALTCAQAGWVVEVLSPCIVQRTGTSPCFRFPVGEDAPFQMLVGLD